VCLKTGRQARTRRSLIFSKNGQKRNGGKTHQYSYALEKDRGSKEKGKGGEREGTKPKRTYKIHLRAYALEIVEKKKIRETAQVVEKRGRAISEKKKKRW